jgi:hypothetical protein
MRLGKGFYLEEKKSRYLDMDRNSGEWGAEVIASLLLPHILVTA